MILHVLAGPTHEYARRDVEPRWCFHCRARLPLTAVLLGDPPSMESYYEPIWVYRCSGCGEDHRYFPGCGPE